MTISSKQMSWLSKCPCNICSEAQLRSCATGVRGKIYAICMFSQSLRPLKQSYDQGRMGGKTMFRGGGGEEGFPVSQRPVPFFHAFSSVVLFQNKCFASLAFFPSLRPLKRSFDQGKTGEDGGKNNCDQRRMGGGEGSRVGFSSLNTRPPPPRG